MLIFGWFAFNYYKVSILSDGAVFQVYRRSDMSGFEIFYDKASGRFELWQTSKNIHGGMVERRLWPNL